jgi:hypothetical protein
MSYIAAFVGYELYFPGPVRRPVFFAFLLHRKL